MTNSKPSTLQWPILTVKLFVGAVAGAGVWSYVQTNAYPMAVVAGLTALVIMMTADHVSSKASSWLLIPLLIIMAAFQAMNVEHSFQFYFEMPTKARFEADLKPLQDEVTLSTERLTKAQEAYDTVPVLQLDPAMPKGRVIAQSEAHDKLLKPLAEAIVTAKADRKIAMDALQTAQGAYKPFAEPEAVLIVGGLLDAFALAAIAGMAGIARKDRQEWEAKLAAKAKADAKSAERFARIEAEYKLREKAQRAVERKELQKKKALAAKKAAKTKAPEGFKPYLVKT